MRTQRGKTGDKGREPGLDRETRSQENSLHRPALPHHPTPCHTAHNQYEEHLPSVRHERGVPREKLWRQPDGESPASTSTGRIRGGPSIAAKQNRPTIQQIRPSLRPAPTERALSARFRETRSHKGHRMWFEHPRHQPHAAKPGERPQLEARRFRRLSMRSDLTHDPGGLVPVIKDLPAHPATCPGPNPKQGG